MAERSSVSGLRSVFSSWWLVVGMMASGLSLLQIFESLVEIGPGQVLAATADTYSALVRPIIRLLFGWLPWHLTGVQQDGLAFWLLIGGGVARAYTVRAPGRMHAAGGEDSTKRAIWFATAFPLCLFAWPLFVGAAFMEPIAVRVCSPNRSEQEHGQRYFVDDMQYRLLTSLGEDLVVEREIDLRVSLAIQVVVVTATMAAFSVASVLSFS